MSVPTSSTIGSVRAGSMPPMRVYSESLPIGMPMPPMPWSPRPRIRCPSVTTITSTSRCGPVAQHLVEAVAVRDRKRTAPRPPVDLAEPLAGLADGRGVDDRQRLGDVVEQHAIEQRLVAVLQRAQVDVLVEIVTASGELVPAVLGLLSSVFTAVGSRPSRP